MWLLGFFVSFCRIFLQQSEEIAFIIASKKKSEKGEFHINRIGRNLIIYNV